MNPCFSFESLVIVGVFIRVSATDTEQTDERAACIYDR